MSIKAAIRLLESRTVSSLLQINQKLRDIRIQGWARRVETRGKFLFVHVSDGYSLKTIQAIVDRNICPKVPVGSAVDIVGDWVKVTVSSKAWNCLQQIVKLLDCNKKCELPNEESCADIARKKYHLRMKSVPFMCLLRLRSLLDQLSRSFSRKVIFQNESFIHVDTPLLTHNDCEGAGNVFTVQAENRNYFDDSTVYLPVSSQLHLESFVGSLPKVYTIAPALRADHSQTRQHLAEFRMLEAEYAFADDLEQLCDLVERYINYVVDGMLHCDTEELNAMMKIFCDEIIPGADIFFQVTWSSHSAKVQSLLWINGPRKPFPRIHYDEVVTQGERVIHGAALFRPVICPPLPSYAEAFYMKRSGNYAECFDLLAPFVGELAGGSLRERDSEELRGRGCDDSLDWYLEMRQHGHPPSAGFGIGLERFMQALFGILNIKDTVAFPRWYKHCPS
ncbi:BMA-NARS-2 [Dirofilaria immitis]|nr:BMA-NARS-2 [Dirofilaria immitis]